MMKDAIVINKKWGSEVIIHNSEKYCGKLLRFNSGSKFSMHFHMKKYETWYVNKGQLILKYIDTNTADELTLHLTKGMAVDIPAGLPHQLEALEDSEIFEVSTQHFDDDSYRIRKGDSQQ